MKNTQGTSVRDLNSEAWIDYYHYLNLLDSYINLTRNSKENWHRPIRPEQCWGFQFIPLR